MAEVKQNLDSWKEIASFLKRGVRTVQRWEREEGLPVHRHQHGKRGTVFAFATEVQLWWSSRDSGSVAVAGQLEESTAELLYKAAPQFIDANNLTQLCMFARERAARARQRVTKRAVGDGRMVPRKPLDTRIGAVDLSVHMQRFERLCELAARNAAFTDEVKALVTTSRESSPGGRGDRLRHMTLKAASFSPR